MSDAFNPFLECCALRLGFLEQLRGFVKKEPVILPPECTLSYRSDLVSLDVIYEYDDYPWIRVTEEDGRQESLDSLMKRYCPDLMIKRKKSFGTTQKIEIALERYAEALNDKRMPLLTE